MAKIEFQKLSVDIPVKRNHFVTKRPVVTVADLGDKCVRNEDLKLYIQHWNGNDEWPVLLNVSIVRTEDDKLIIVEGDVAFRSKGDGWEPTR